MALDFIIQRIKEKTNLSEEQIRGKINAKLRSLSGLATEEGAATIVANELGVDLKREEVFRTKIKNLKPDMKNVYVYGRISEIFPVRTWAKGKIGTFSILDDTGKIRVIIWDSRVSLIEKGTIKAGDVLKISRAYVKKGLYGDELHLGDRTAVEINPKDAAFLSKPVLPKPVEKVEPAFSFISKLKEGKCRIFATAVAITDFSISNGAIMLGFIADDGSANIRCTATGPVAERLLGASAQQAKDNTGLAQKMIGKDFLLIGAAKNLNSAPEFSVDDFVADLKPEVQANALLGG